MVRVSLASLWKQLTKGMLKKKKGSCTKMLVYLLSWYVNLWKLLHNCFVTVPLCKHFEMCFLKSQNVVILRKCLCSYSEFTLLNSSKFRWKKKEKNVIFYYSAKCIIAIFFFFVNLCILYVLWLANAVKKEAVVVERNKWLRHYRRPDHHVTWSPRDNTGNIHLQLLTSDDKFVALSLFLRTFAVLSLHSWLGW